MTTSPAPSMHPSRTPALGALACLVLTCVVAPPVRGASEAGQASDGGGCNGGRNVPVMEGGESTTDGPGSTGETTQTTTEPGRCGDGMVDVGEACDDGNEVEEDGCPSGAAGQCKGEARCGDGFVWAGQEGCDDGNHEDGDGCEADCVLTPTVCGNGKQEVGEGCDDGNDMEKDACPSGAVGQCKAAAKCGDGFVWAGVEGCDDGNDGEGDECPSGAGGQCKAVAKCGDGFVWKGKEVCDDSNVEDTDACPSGVGGCKAVATCGDGYVLAGVEDCDDMNAEDLDACNDACASPRWVFVTSNSGLTGNLGGVAGADAYCQSVAETAGLAGTYMAWLSGQDPASAPATRFASTGFKGWYLLPGGAPTPVALGWADLTSPNEGMPANYLRSAIHRNEDGDDIIEGTVWTNTNSDGSQETADSNCLDWMSVAFMVKGRIGHAIADGVDETWTSIDAGGCSGGNRLNCFQEK